MPSPAPPFLTSEPSDRLLLRAVAANHRARMAGTERAMGGTVANRRAG